ncbi:hypothetical protein AK812_SmicGene37212 [Symbiodinium microadriaticum]|uniref:Uncharacterized protein n=1 Tax=Symbiodinium microadriaticum TaxID=2951 RepID=A0A1Q9CGV7_SYMMI|nr:hypothetical protein AK812_SmicGene37212 [Symbiodinium microadriaticum]CAE7504640.1 unnamed protein product [Symbiodinium microadriaticum]CAE7810487.1 unnamed protein product [Symbiodinium sp. KB8]
MIRKLGSPASPKPTLENPMIRELEAPTWASRIVQYAGREIKVLLKWDSLGKPTSQAQWNVRDVVPNMKPEHETNTGQRIIASTMPTSLLFALLLHLFSCPKGGPKDRRAAGNMLRWLVSSRMPGRMVNLLYFRPDGTYSYKQAEIDEVDGTVPNAWPQDFSDFLARVWDKDLT